MIKVLFMGRKDVSAQSLKFLLSLNNVKVVGVLTDNHLSISPTTEVAHQNNLPLYSFKEALNLLQTGQLRFDLGISMLYWRKLKNEFLSMPRLGVINFHPAPLPDYKGTAGYNMAILNHCDEWAVTSHYIDEGIDTGEIIDVIRFPIHSDLETAQTLEKKTQPILFEHLQIIVRRVLQVNGLLPTTINRGGRYISRQEMEDMKEILPGDDISRKIRAFWFPPYDGAYIMIDEVKYTLVDRIMLQRLADPTVSTLFTKDNVNS